MLRQISYVGLIAAALAAPPVLAQTAADQAPPDKMAPAASPLSLPSEPNEIKI